MKVDFKQAVRGALLGSVVLLTGTGVMGCGGKEEVPSTPSLLEGTILENTYVITDSNDSIFVVRPTEEYYGRNIYSFDDNLANHYIDVLSDNCYHEKMHDSDVTCFYGKKGVSVIDIKERNPISVYLTSEDLLKSEFSDEDIVEIIQRARENDSTDTNTSKGVEYTK